MAWKLSDKSEQKARVQGLYFSSHNLVIAADEAGLVPAESWWDLVSAETHPAQWVTLYKIHRACPFCGSLIVHERFGLNNLELDIGASCFRATPSTAVSPCKVLLWKVCNFYWFSFQFQFNKNLMKVASFPGFLHFTFHLSVLLNSLN